MNQIAKAIVYVVVEDGCTEGYGIRPCLIGVFTSKEMAESMIEKSIDKNYPREIHEIELDTEFPLGRASKYDNYWNDYVLGDYIE